MKIKIHLPITLLIVASLCFQKGFGQIEHEILLSLDRTTSNFEPKLTLSTASKTKSSHNKLATNMTLSADVGDTVLWKCSSSDDLNEKVILSAIHYVSGPRIFTSNTITGEKTIKATIVRGGAQAYVYKLNYTIGSEPKVYTITGAIKTKM